MKPSHMHRAEPLEPRLALAGLFTFTDVDGDLVAIRTSRGTDADLAASVTLAASGAGQQLRRIVMLSPVFTGSDLSVAVRTRAVTGDGRVNVGAIHALTSLGAVTVRGDLGKVTSISPLSNSIAKLTVGSIGRYGTFTGAPDNQSIVNGSIGSLKIEGDLDRAALDVTQRLEKAVIGGSVIGVSAGDGIHAGGIGSLTVGGSLIGGSQPTSGTISTVGSTIGRIRIRGDVAGGTGQNSGKIWSDGIGECRIGGSVTGNGGVSGGAVVAGDGGIKTITIGGGVIGGGGDQSGFVFTSGDIRSARIGGQVVGGSGANSGVVNAVYGLRKLTIGGDIVGGSGSFSGMVWSQEGLIARLDARSLVASDGLMGGSIVATLVGQVSLSGDMRGSLTRSASIVAQGSAWSTGPTIGTVRVRGSLSRAAVLAGYNITTPVNGSVRIGTVTIGGTMSESSIAAGVENIGGLFRLGTAADAAIGGGVSRIDAVTVAGRATGGSLPGESYGIVASSVGRVRIAGTRFTPAPGSFTYPNADNFAIHVL